MPELVLTIKAIGTEFLQGFADGIKQAGEEADRAGQGIDRATAASERQIPAVITLNNAWELFGKVAGKVNEVWTSVTQGIDRGGTFNDLSARVGVSVETLSSEATSCPSIVDSSAPVGMVELASSSTTRPFPREGNATPTVRPPMTLVVE